MAERATQSAWKIEGRTPSAGTRVAWHEASPLLRMARDAAWAQAQAVAQDGDADERCSAAMLGLVNALPELNLAVGLQSAAYDEQQYLELLRTCCIAFAQRADALEQAQREKDAVRMRLETHTLRGSLSSIGAEQLGRHAGELETAIYEGQATQVRIQAPAFLAEFREFLARLHGFLGQVDGAHQDAGVDPRDGIERDDGMDPCEGVDRFDCADLRNGADRSDHAEQQETQPKLDAAITPAAQEIALPDFAQYPILWQETAEAMLSKAIAYDYGGALLLLRTLEAAHAPEDGPWLSALRGALEAFDYGLMKQLLQALPRRT